MDMATTGDTVQFPKEPVNAPNKRTLLDTNNCPDMGATIFLTGLHQMKRMGLSRKREINIDLLMLFEKSRMRSQTLAPASCPGLWCGCKAGHGQMGRYDDGEL